MSWLRRVRRPPSSEEASKEPEEHAPAAVERSAPGLAALFAGTRADASHNLLDLGSASEAHLDFYRPYARRVRFADLLPAPPAGAVWREALLGDSGPARMHFDLILAWNVLDLIPPGERGGLIACLAEITPPGARLYASVDATGGATVQPQRFTILGMDRISQRPVGAPRGAQRQILPAEMERLLSPFEIRNGFTVRVGVREYVAVRTAGGR